MIQSTRLFCLLSRPFCSSPFYSQVPHGWNLDEDNIIDIGISPHAKQYGHEQKGELLITATPIGNLEDYSIRMYEALTSSDIIACEDTRVTGLLLQLLKKRKLKEKLESYSEQELQELNEEVEYTPEEQRQQRQIKRMAQEDPEETKEERMARYKMEVEQERTRRLNEIKAKAKRLLQDQDSLKDFYNLSDEEEDEYFQQQDSGYGLFDDQVSKLRDKVRDTRTKKGRGILVCYQQYNEAHRTTRLLSAIKHGLRVTLVSDAGTPCISDPGYHLVSMAQLEGLKVTSIPGPSAATVALTLSGFPADKYLFNGYINKLQASRLEVFEAQKRDRCTAVYFESPHRLMATLLSIEKVFGQDQIIFIGIELTKLFERHLRDTVRTLSHKIHNMSTRLRGELTIVIPPYTPEYNIALTTSQQHHDHSDSPLSKEIHAQQLIITLEHNLEVSDRDLAELVSQIMGISRTKASHLVRTHRHQQNSTFMNKYTK